MSRSLPGAFCFSSRGGEYYSKKRTPDRAEPLAHDLLIFRILGIYPKRNQKKKHGMELIDPTFGRSRFSLFLLLSFVRFFFFSLVGWDGGITSKARHGLHTLTHTHTRFSFFFLW